MTSKKKIHRRQFVKDASTAVAGAGILAAGSGAGLGLYLRVPRLQPSGETS